MSKKIIRQKINDTFLRKALATFATQYPVARTRAFEGTDFETLRERISSSRKAALRELPSLLEEFRTHAEKSGATVYLCTTPQDALATILKIIRDKDADFVVKSKSMTSEEIRLNPYLEKAGIRTLETDLGEWIIQLAGERPSHMVLPAIHKNREEVADLFSRETGHPCPPDISSLVETARTTLREGFLTARVGITGANVAIADSGTICLVTNEGNARLVTTLPETHIALIGLEKIVSTMTEALDIITMLPKNATGQKITSYVSFIKGPSTGKDLHIVLLDNGRRELANDPCFSEALTCIKCGACSNVCPVYEIVGGHVFGHIYVGGIGLVLTPFFHGNENAREILGLCIGCRRCNEICAAKIDIEGLILDLRERATKLPAQKTLIGAFMKNRTMFHSALRAAYFAQKPFQGKDGRIRHLPLVLSGDTAGRSLPPIAEQPFHAMVTTPVDPPNPEQGKRQKVLFFSGCLADFVFPEICRDTMESLEMLGYDVSFPKGQLCCGIPARYSGEMEIARDMARLNTEVLLQEQADFVVTICPTCTISLKHDFPKLLAGDPDYHEKSLELAAKVFNFTELAARKIKIPDKTTSGKAVTYHDACHLRRGCGVYREPRMVMESITGQPVVEMEGSDTCCGFGGSYAFKQQEISGEILKRKLYAVVATGADTVAVDCPGCKMQIEGGLEGIGSPVRVQHSASLVAERLRGLCEAKE
ncbi:MAG: LUD domain-containing protein [Geobacteraceae bacterium]|nr:LUD domain-containing protein [Geobacteraceae bacterium]